ncbi:unnamed protein product [Caenorhabditis bovis]|uniref:Uncharacterized protein n=1 Tax=Caenorhabditis bovis TaxID=2654633 RepID=A0A8S1EUY5_9PELO|nr:unnamed protein product [Caenorhabditis bovis]
MIQTRSGLPANDPDDPDESQEHDAIEPQSGSERPAFGSDWIASVLKQLTRGLENTLGIDVTNHHWPRDHCHEYERVTSPHNLFDPIRSDPNHPSSSTTSIDDVDDELPLTTAHVNEEVDRMPSPPSLPLMPIPLLMTLSQTTTRTTIRHPPPHTTLAAAEVVVVYDDRADPHRPHPPPTPISSSTINLKLISPTPQAILSENDDVDDADDVGCATATSLPLTSILLLMTPKTTTTTTYTHHPRQSRCH